jgi:organic hydroperoxide reductase OsmC/OhrA
MELNLALRKEVGGSGKGENPKQLFAMGYPGKCLTNIKTIMLI